MSVSVGIPLFIGVNMLATCGRILEGTAHAGNCVGSFVLTPYIYLVSRCSELVGAISSIIILLRICG